MAMEHAGQPIERLRYAWRTHEGRVRPHNEDAVAVHPELGLIAVADGVGGANAGEVASHLAVDTIVARFRRQREIPRLDPKATSQFARACVEEANIAVWRAANTSSGCKGMGTTLVLGIIGPDWMVCAHVGDSRLYRLHQGALKQISRDHSLIQEVVDQGFFDSREAARRSGIGENVLTRALGSTPSIQVGLEVVDLAPGDVFLFCTDGLSGPVPEGWMRDLLGTVDDIGLEAAADQLLTLAHNRGGPDNITLALLQVESNAARTPG